MSLEWVDINDRKPEDGQYCLTEMKHGFVSGCYVADEQVFRGYYWHDMEWFAYRWIPIADVK